MSSRVTATSSLTHKYCCFRREPQALCSRLNEMARLASVAEKSLTGMETSPNETVNDAIDRAAISSPPTVPQECGGTDCNPKEFFRLWRPAKPSRGCAFGSE